MHTISKVFGALCWVLAGLGSLVIVAWVVGEALDGWYKAIPMSLVAALLAWGYYSARADDS